MNKGAILLACASTIVSATSCSDIAAPSRPVDGVSRQSVVPEGIVLYNGPAAVQYLREVAAGAHGDSKNRMNQLLANAGPSKLDGSSVPAHGFRIGTIGLPNEPLRDLVTDAQNNIPNAAWKASVLSASTSVVMSGQAAGLGSGVSFFGTHGENVITYSTSGAWTSGSTLPGQEGNDNGAWMTCVSNLSPLATCAWVDSYTSAASLDLSAHTCGVIVTASGAHRAWFALPGISIALGVISLGSTVSKFGITPVTVDGGGSDSQGPCSPSGGGGDPPGGSVYGPPPPYTPPSGSSCHQVLYSWGWGVECAALASQAPQAEPLSAARPRKGGHQ